MIKHIAAVIFIYICTTIAWFILGGTVLSRTYSSDSSNKEKVEQLWGSAQTQICPEFHYHIEKTQKVQKTVDKKVVVEDQTYTEKHDIPLDSSAINVDLKLSQRKKGLLWYATYKVGFSGKYKITNPTDKEQTVHVEFLLPAKDAIYDNLRIELGNDTVKNIEAESSNSRVVAESNNQSARGRKASGSFGLSSFGGYDYSNDNKLCPKFKLAPGASQTVTIGYDSQGLSTWLYKFGSGVSQVKNFSMTMHTDFNDIDFPANSMSPTSKEKSGNGWDLNWDYQNLLTGYSIGMEMPQMLNPGPWVSKVTFFAPVSLFLFYFLLFIFTTLKGIRVHPMNYFFIGASFFSFHLLLAYLVDHISIHLAFAICSAVSIFLTVSYMRLVTGNRFAFLEVGVSQFIYLVLFSYTFFFEQYTGLVITILCILTLFVVMQMTGRVNWYEVSGRQGQLPPLG